MNHAGVPERLIERLEGRQMSGLASTLTRQHDAYFNAVSHGDFRIWRAAVNSLPDIVASRIALDQAAIQIGDPDDCSDDDREELKKRLRVLMPWRKGPFNWFGIDLDAEWRSNLKWDRLAGNLSPLAGRVILDVGCGNGYYAWRTLGRGADAIVGVDPTLRYVMQYHAANRYINDDRLYIFPFKLEALECRGLCFDSVFSMGVIYHQRDPVAHLDRLYQCLRPGGELILETLIVNRGNMEVLRPRGRYAKMNNVRHIPSCGRLLEWIADSGFINAQLVDISPTTTVEQRGTEWMIFESLADFLDANDQNLTVEGYPAPKRAIVIAGKP